MRAFALLRAVHGEIEAANEGNVTRILACPPPAYRRGGASAAGPRAR